MKSHGNYIKEQSPRGRHYSPPYRRTILPRVHIPIIRIVFAVLAIAVLYLLIFTPPLPQSIMPIITPVMYLMEFLILVFGLITLTGVSRGGVGSAFAMMMVGIFIGLFGIYWWFTSGFAPREYFMFEFWFGVVLGALGFFTAIVALLNGISMRRIFFG